jgi:hypothetical protein
VAAPNRLRIMSQNAQEAARERFARTKLLNRYASIVERVA